jgi:hypothetical protein
LSLDTILTELKSERDRVTRAIAALESLPAPFSVGRRKVSRGRKRGRRRMSAAARKRIGQAKRKWWAERKKRVKGT